MSVGCVIVLIFVASGFIGCWNNSNTAIGLAANGTGSIAPFTAQNASNGPQVATLVITASYTNAGLTCQTASSTSITTGTP